MKKTLLSLTLSLLSVAAYAAEPEVMRIPAPASEVATSRSATDDGFQLRFCGEIDIYNALTSASNITYICYQYITPEIATQLAGNTVNSVSFSAYVTSVAAGLEGSIFVKEDMDADPVSSTTAKIVNGVSGNIAKIQTVDFEEPYVIKDGVGFYFGYTVEKCKANKDYPFATDANAPSSFAGTVNLKSSLTGSDRGTYNIGEKIGANMVLFANTVGDKHAVENLFGVGVPSFGNFTMPVVDLNTGLLLPITNYGSNAVTSVTYTVEANGAEAVTSTEEINVPSGEATKVSLPMANVIEGNNEVAITIDNVNGVAIGTTVTAKFFAVNGGYPRKFVVEEGTGTWCGWCPRGIVGLETMTEKYPDTFIGIAVHSGDDMAVSSYSPLINKFFEGFPSCVVNRDPYYVDDPSYEVLEEAYKAWSTQVAIAKIDLSVVKTNAAGSRVEATAKTTFCLSTDEAKYAIAFVLLEDGLTDIQQNYYANNARGPMGGWEKMGSSVNWTYKDTARGIYTCWGQASSIPTVIEAGVEYEHTYKMMLTNIKKVANTSIVALLLDTTNGTILNAAKVKADEYAGINDIVSDDDEAPAEYYNLQGIRMDGNSLPAGIYVVKQGNKVTKEIRR